MGRLKGVRPLGGSVEFGETREDALRREFLEEIGAAIRIIGPWEAIENLFRHEGVVGHEIIFAAPIVLPDGPFDLDAPLAFDDGMPCIARWFEIGDLKRGEPRLFPTGLADRLDVMLHRTL
ncbi:NUDIX domain-containing protein [Aureimonas sp. ME7]|uniref:NUDIX domain-containing protein n=1 Tax=Aureimonas sp. ME7 TaxID=2744252 RepID=UPI0015F6F245